MAQEGNGMSYQPVLTIAVPIYNMDQCLDKNLTTYWDSALKERLEVLCLNNDSTDSSDPAGAMAVLLTKLWSRPEEGTFAL